MNIADRQKSTWNVASERLAFKDGIDPKDHRQEPGAEVLGEAAMDRLKSRVRRQTGSPKRVCRLAIERASGFLGINSNDANDEG